jgi:hypothetical protein
MFVCFGFDDNGYADGIKWFRDLVKNKKNDDGSPVRATFFCTGTYGQNFAEVAAEWKTLHADGHEIANHTMTHPHGQGYSSDQWKNEISQASTYLAGLIGTQAGAIKGFRTPFLEVSANTFTALKQLTMYYDCTLEAGYGIGWQGDGTDGVWWWSMSDPEMRKRLFWPHTLDAGVCPATASSVKGISCPGMWEVYVYTYLVEKGVEVGGFDFNLWKVSDKAKFVRVLKYNFDLQYSGNRCPLTINAHTDYYTPNNDAANKEFTLANYSDRKAAMEEFLAYVLTKPGVRVVPYISLITWMKNPVPINGATAKDRDQVIIANQSRLTLSSVSRRCVQLVTPIRGNYQITLCSVQGKKIHAAEIRSNGTQETIVTFNHPLSPGAYFLRVDDGEHSMVKRVILSR